MKCPGCNSTRYQSVELEFPAFNNLDFKTMGNKGRLAKCHQCQLIFNRITNEDNSYIRNLFSSDRYAKSNQTHRIRSGQTEELITRPVLQARFISSLLKKNQLSALDIGCFRGELLLELNRIFSNPVLHGFDINPHIAESFPRESNFYLWTNSLHEIDATYDLICLSYSIMYIDDLSDLARQLDRLLKPHGVIYIQAPDILVNSCYLLMGDQYHYVTVLSLYNIFQDFGFVFNSLEDDRFGKDIIGIVKRSKDGVEKEMREDDTLQNCIHKLHDTAERLDQIDTRGPVGVLGTTVNAAYVDEYMNDQICFFSDENPEKVGIEFRGKHVIHPNSVDSSATVIIPYGNNSRNIEMRMRKLSKARYVCV